MTGRRSEQHNLQQKVTQQQANAESATARLIALLDRQVSHLDRMETLSRQQSVCASGGDVAPLGAIITERAQLIQQMTDIDTSISQARAELDRLSERGKEVDARIPASTVEIGRKTLGIAERDRETVSALSRRKSAIAAELASFGQSSAAVNAYGRVPVGAQPRFQDREA